MSRKKGSKHGVGEWGMEGRKVEGGTLRFTARSPVRFPTKDTVKKVLLSLSPFTGKHVKEHRDEVTCPT